MTLRAFGGGTLRGESVARFVYLDEAGTSNKTQEPWLVVGGAIVHGDHQIDKLYSALAEISRKHVPEEKTVGACPPYLRHLRGERPSL
jgi:hypothetical protein